MNVSSVVVLICTYNRAALLKETLAAIQSLTPPSDCRVSILVVDNNSTDDTRAVLANADGPYPLITLSERQQGKGFALNAGLAAATADVLALTDDDVIPAADWLDRIVEGFRRHDVTFVFGKVLPRWGRIPPPELLTTEAQDIWGPLAIMDYGDDAVEYTADNMLQRLPIGANLAFARAALASIGGWRTDLGKVNNSLISGEDHEIFIRLRRFGLYAGYYDPLLVVQHFVPPGRLTRRYFRRWFFWHGKTHAIMIDDIYPQVDMAKVPRIGGAPRFAYRQALTQLGRWMSTRWSDPLTALSEELRLLQFAGLFAECWRQRWRKAAGARQSPPQEAAGQEARP